MPASESDPLDLCDKTLAHKYLVQELVDVGGFSIVYRAHHTVWRKPVAIKFFNALSLARSEQRQALQEAFVREGALLAELSSRTTSIVQAWDVGTHSAPGGEWMPYMVLEWLDGKPLDRIIDEELAADAPRWSFAEVHAFLAEVAAALELAHQQGIAHRDVKPANLFVVGDARAGGVVKILDFGIAKVMADRTLTAELATTGMSIRSFTPDYGAPEQFSRDYGATGPWTDVFGLALCAVELLTRSRPLGEGEIVELASASTDLNQRPTPAARGVPTPPAIEAVFRRALAVSPRERYATAGAFWRELGEAIAGRSNVTLREFPMLTSPLDSSAELRAMSASVAPRRRSFAKLGVFGALTAAALAGLAFVAIDRLWPSQAHAKPPAELEGVSAAVLAVVQAAAREQCPAGMVKIPAGQFYMGSHEPSALPNEKPSFNVRLPAFCIDLTEVTVAAYRACSDRGACPRAGRTVHWPNVTAAQKRVYGPECNDARDDRLDHPINCVSHSMAARFCEQTGRRLPTEAEWEYATRGPDGRVYPWGDDAPTPRHLNACGSECVAWGKQRREPLTALYDASDGFPTTAPVGRFQAGRSRFGPYDVVGNVWEWVADWYADYTPDEKTNPKGPASGERKVIRGGGWNGSYATWLRPSFRYAQDPEALSAGIGFRCALSLPRKP